MTNPEALVARILGAYPIDYSSIEAPQKGYRNGSFGVQTNRGKLNVIVYKTEAGIVERIRNANVVGNFLAEQGLPARRTFSPKILQLRSNTITKYAAIYYYLPGHTIPWEAYTMNRIKALGEMMGKMHSLLRNFDGELPDASAEFTQLTNRMQRYFSDMHVAEALQKKLGLLPAAPIFDHLFTVPIPKQTLHLDFVRGNILFEDAHITGIFDFEKTARGPVEYDLARTLAFLLVDCKYKPEAKIRKYFLQSGYVKRGGGIIANQNLLEQLVSFFLLHDFYKFLRHNPYESLPQNEHFMRTRAILLQRGLIRVK